MGMFKRKKKEDGGTAGRARAAGDGGARFTADGRRRSLRELIAPNGANLVPLPYMTINDGGTDTYYMGFVMIRNAMTPTIASTYTRLSDFPGMTSAVYVHPLLEESARITNRRIRMLDAEMETAADSRVRQRELSGSLAEAEDLARGIDSGETTLYEVYFLYLLRRPSLRELYDACGEVASLARSMNMELSATYASHPETFLSTLPCNRLYPVTYGRRGPGFSPYRKFIMDERSLSTTFNHTTTEFCHRDGVLLGHNMYSGLPFAIDMFDRSHYSYGMFIAGLSGYGKSATVKEAATRLVDFGYSFASIDYENNGQGGEYAPGCRAVGGVSYSIGLRDGGDRLNLFEINEETERDEVTGQDVRTLRVDNKTVDLVNILLSIALSSVSDAASVNGYEAAEVDRMQEIISRAVQELYDDFGIEEGKPDSLYEAVEGADIFSMGRRRKRLPQMRDFYLRLLRDSASNRDAFKRNAYALLLDKFYNRVADLWYCPECFREFTAGEAAAMPLTADGRPYHGHGGGRQIALRHVRGTAAYFDCQSTVSLGSGKPWYNFDISGAPETERPVLILICQNFINENFVKRNSVNPLRAKKLVFFIDEFYKIRQPKAIKFMAATYRTARKRHCSPWIITQSVSDLDRFEADDEIIKHTAMMMLFKHRFEDREALKRLAKLSDSQADAVINLGGDPRKKIPGQACVVDVATSQTSFVQIDYLRRSEELIVETDTERKAEMLARSAGTQKGGYADDTHS